MSAPAVLARAIWQAGVDAVGGYAATEAALGDIPRPDRILAVGKAAGEMSRAALARFPGVPALVVTKDGHAEGLTGAEVIESAHPVPDARSLRGGAALRTTVGEMANGSRLLLLVSGGASALAEDLVPGTTLDDLAALNRRLLGAGLDITAMNEQRRQISRVKGGGLLSGFHGAHVDVLAISDVPGDDLAVIGSGIGAPPDDFAPGCTTRIIASNTIARDAAAAHAEGLGLTVQDNREALHDDLSALAETWGPRIRDMAPGVLILGGEPTVHLPDDPGEGGRNQALALALAREISGTNGLAVIVGGTDGSDGPTGAAGGIVTGATWAADGADALKRADSGPFLRAAGALLETGPTGTNVMDLLVAVRS
jgi:hydroxypyruvate reductase